VSNVEDENMAEEENKEGEGYLSYAYNKVASIFKYLWNTVVWIRDLFVARQDLTADLSGEEFRHVFTKRLQELGL
jgi:hypothetical protein